MKAKLAKYVRDYAGGALMLLIGIGAVIQGQTYSIGSLSKMGPGYFPVALGTLLTVLGIALLIDARLSQPKTEAKSLPPEWRGWICIVLSIIAFAVIGKYGGLIPATIATVVISALGERNNTWRSALALASVMVVVCVVLFWWGLNLQFPLFAWGQS